MPKAALSAVWDRLGQVIKAPLSKRKCLYSILLLLSSQFLWAEDSKEMEAHKAHWKKAISSNPLNYRDCSYQMERALLTITGDDSDYIPKVAGAGGIFTEGELSYQLMHQGVKIVVNSYYDTQWLTDVIYGLQGHHEPQEEKCFYELLKYIPKNAIMIELGSYWAYYSLWFSFAIEGAKNYLIEPNSRYLETGRKNFELNHKIGYFFHGFAGAIVEADPDMKGAKLISIDDFIEEEGIEHVDILHADIQGGEYEMLKSALQSLDIIDYFVISTHNCELHHLPCLYFLKNHGFVILAEHTASESCSGDGLIVAKRKDVNGPEKISIRKY